MPLLVLPVLPGSAIVLFMTTSATARDTFTHDGVEFVAEPVRTTLGRPTGEYLIREFGEVVGRIKRHTILGVDGPFYAWRSAGSEVWHDGCPTAAYALQRLASAPRAGAL